MSEPARVPVVLQVDPDECAAACLAMILGSHGLRGDLAACRSRLRPEPEGVSAAILAEAAREAGLTVRAYQVPGRTAFEVLPLPAIIHWRIADAIEDDPEVPEQAASGGHYVVLESRSDRGVRIVDPARGRRRLSWRQLLRGSSGAALTFSVDAGASRSGWSDTESVPAVRFSLLELRAMRWPVVGALGVGGGLGTLGAGVLGLVERSAVGPGWVALAACSVWAAVVELRAVVVETAGRYVGGALALDASRDRWVLAEQLERLARSTVLASRLAARLRATAGTLVCRGAFDTGACAAILGLLAVRSPRFGAVVGLGLAVWLGLDLLGSRRLPAATLRGVPRGERASLRALDLLLRFAAEKRPMRRGRTGLRGLGAAAVVVAILVHVAASAGEHGLGRGPAIVDGALGAALAWLVGRLSDALRRLQFAEPGGIALATAIDQDSETAHDDSA